MIESILFDELRECLRANPALNATHVYVAHENTEHRLPAITISGSSESLAGSTTVFRCEVEIEIESNAHDVSPAEHEAIGHIVAGMLTAKTSFIATLNASGRLRIFGYAALGSQPAAEDGRFISRLRYRFGCGFPAN